MNYDSLKNIVVGILKAKVNCGHRHPNTEQALQWEALSMVMSNLVLTGIRSCHRNLEHAVLELILFKLSHQNGKTQSPPQMTVLHTLQHVRPGKDYWAFLGTIF